MYLGAIDSIAAACRCGKVVRDEKGFWKKVETLCHYVAREAGSRDLENRRMTTEVAKLKTRSEDLTRQLEHVAKDRKAAIDGFQESVEENNKNMRDAIGERGRIERERDIDLSRAQLRIDELEAHRSVLMAKLGWYHSLFGPIKGDVIVTTTPC